MEVVCGYVPFLLERDVKLFLLHEGCQESWISSQLTPLEVNPADRFSYIPLCL